MVVEKQAKTSHFQWPWKILPPISRSRHSLTLNISESRHNFNGILIGRYTRLTQQCHFTWPSVTLSDVAKYSMTPSIARSVCDSWASCINCSEKVHIETDSTGCKKAQRLHGVIASFHLHWIFSHKVANYEDVCSCRKDSQVKSSQVVSLQILTDNTQ